MPTSCPVAPPDNYYYALVNFVLWGPGAAVHGTPSSPNGTANPGTLPTGSLVADCCWPDPLTHACLIGPPDNYWCAFINHFVWGNGQPAGSLIIQGGSAAHNGTVTP
ncbi:MAG: hypothetical protein QOI63_801 [Thermoplasmata archaeon]|nr:hypothetical protein [Thermoplasmata archaeon]